MDFAALVLGPAMAVFGQPITVTPTKSQPNAAAFQATGVFDFKPVEIRLEGSDDFHQTNQPELGIRISDFPALPAQGDKIVMTQGTFTIFNVIVDGQGGARLILRAAV